MGCTVVGSSRGAVFGVTGNRLMPLRSVLGTPSGMLLGIGMQLKSVEQPLPKAGGLSRAGLGRLSGQGKRGT